jgi:hypothetical protein
VNRRWSRLASIGILLSIAPCKNGNDIHRGDPKTMERNPLEQVVFPASVEELANVTSQRLREVSGSSISRRVDGPAVVLTTEPVTAKGAISLQWTARLTPAQDGGARLTVMKSGVKRGSENAPPTEALVRDSDLELRILQLIDPKLAAQVARAIARDDRHVGVHR